MKYRKKPVIVDAIEFTRDNWNEIVEFTNGKACNLRIERRPDGICTCIIPMLEGNHTALEGDYIIRGIKGEFYPCKPDIFENSYETYEE